jgi:hypothetical protein
MSLVAGKLESVAISQSGVITGEVGLPFLSPQLNLIHAS